MKNWNEKVKWLLKTELAKKGISNAQLAEKLQEIGVKESKASIDSKISRGYFSAAFFMQCLYVLGDVDADLSSPLYVNTTVDVGEVVAQNR